jgi:hypothetical protein
MNDECGVTCDFMWGWEMKNKEECGVSDKSHFYLFI